MARHLSMDELKAGLPEILASPKDDGAIEGIVIRPKKRERIDAASAEISLARGVHGDHWEKGCWKTTEDGKPDPDVQICIMNSRCIGLIAQERENWAPAGDNLFVDMDLTPENLPVGQRLSLGSAEIEITEVPHAGCSLFIKRYGRDACVFVNTVGKPYRLRGVYGRVVKDGAIKVGDRLKKIG